MALPALLSPETWVVPESLPHVEPTALAHLAAEVRHLIDDVRRSRPPEGTPEEMAALSRVALFGFTSLRLLGSGFIVVQRSSLNQALADLVRKELIAADAERKLALRHIEQAVHAYGVLVESIWAALSDLPPSSVRTLFEDLSTHVKMGEFQLTETDRTVLRLQLDVMVALDVLDAPIEELTHWAFRAITDARRVEALPPVLSPAGLRGELARLRSRRSWLSWDAAELAEELAPWPSSSR